MKKRICLAALLAWAVSKAFGAPSYDHLYAFGDSYSDNGAGESFTKQLVEKKVKDAQELPGLLYWNGRWSNGPTAVENLAASMKLPLTDYAVGGAKSGDGNYYAWMGPFKNTGVFGQISEYLASTKQHRADSKALYFIFISANDFFEWADFSHTETMGELSQASMDNILKATQRLAAAGAKNFMVVGTTDLSHVPAVVSGNQVKNALEYQQALEEKLPGRLAELAKSLNVKITYFDHLAFSNKIRAMPNEAGLTDVDAPCQATYPEVKPMCKDPDAHYYWDEWHPTRKIHSLAGQAMLKALTASD